MTTRRDLVAIFAIGALVSAFWIVKIWSDRPDTMSQHARDLYSSYLPNIQYCVEEMRSGRLPLWNPYEFAGMPMLATLEHGALYPLTVLYALGDIAEMHLLSGFVHTLLFGAFMFLFARVALNVGVVSAIFAALIAVLSGWSASRSLIYPDEFRSGVYIPLILLCADRTIVSGGARWGIGLTLAIALQFLAGELEIVVRTAILLIAYAVFRLISHRRTADRPQTFSRAVLLASACVAAMLLVAVQLIPTWQLSQSSLRSTNGLSYEQAIDPIDGGVEQPGRLLELMISDGGSPYVFYVGIFPLLLAAYAIARRRRGTAFFGVAAIVLFLLLLGDGSPLYWLYYNLPTGDWFRFPLRFQPFFVVSVAALAALGLDQWLADRRHTDRNPRVAAVVLATATLLACVLFDFKVNTIESTIAIAAAAVLVVVNERVHRRPPALHPAYSLMAIAVPILLTPMLVFDLSAYIVPRNPDLVGLPRRVQDAIDLQRSIAGRVYIDATLDDGRRVPKYGTLTRTPCLDGFSPFMSARYWDTVKPYRAQRLQESAAALEAAGYESSLGLWGGLSAANGALDALNVFGVERIVVGPGSELFRADGRVSREDILPEFEVLDETDGLFVLRNPDALPRAFVLPENEYTFDDLARLNRDSTTAATIVDYAPSRVVIDIPQDGLLVLTDEFATGWSAFADGKPVETVRVANLFRGVPVDAGISRIEFRYEPHGFIIGGFISGATLVVIISALIVDLAVRKHPHRVE